MRRLSPGLLLPQLGGAALGPDHPHAALSIDAPEFAAPIYERLVPYAQTLCVVSLNLSEMGPVARPLGVLATLMGNFSHAERHFEDALATSERIGAPPHLARASSDYARMLLARNAPGDAERARQLLGRARSIAQDIGMAGVISDVDELEHQLVGG